MMSTLIQNNIVTKHKTSSQEKQSTSKMLKESPALNKAASSDQGETRQGSGDKEERSNKSNKIVISNKSRLNAYIKGKRVKQATATNTEGNESREQFERELSTLVWPSTLSVGGAAM